MATNSGVRMDRGDWGTLYDRITFVADQLPVVLADAMTEAGEGATQVMENRIRTATTAWGMKRMAEGRASAGRIETGAMIESLRANGFGESNAIDVIDRGNGRVTARVGFHDAPDYTKYQEEGTATITAMFAVQLGVNYFMSHVNEIIAAGFRALQQDAMAGRASRRAANYRSGFASRIRRRPGSRR